MKIKLTALCALASLVFGNNLFAKDVCYDEYKTETDCKTNPFCHWVSYVHADMCMGSDCTDYAPPSCAGTDCHHVPGGLEEYCVANEVVQKK